MESNAKSTSPLRVLIVNRSLLGGGIDNQSLELATVLADQGESVVLCIPEGRQLESRTRRSRVEVHTIPPARMRGFALIRAYARLVRRHNIQIIHAHQGRDYWPAIIAARLARRGTRVVITRHLAKRPHGLSRKLLLYFADVAAVSNAVLKVLQRELRGPRNHLHQIHCGIDSQAFTPETHRTEAALFRAKRGWHENTVVFGLVGGFSPPFGKGHLEFLSAAAQLHPGFPDARWVIFGGSAVEAEFHHRVAELRLEGIATLDPFFDDVTVPIAALDVLVHPAKELDAFPLVVLEGMASGKPVIASRIGGIPEQFREGKQGLFVQPGDAADLARAMRTLLEDPAQRRRLGQAGPDHIRENFSRERLGEKFRALYVHLLSQT